MKNLAIQNNWDNFPSYLNGKIVPIYLNTPYK